MKRFETLYKMKQELKAIRDGSSWRKRYEYRHLHIARCLIKGRKMEEIERLVRDDNKRDEKYLQKLLDLWKPLHDAEQAAWLATTREVALAAG